MKFLDQSGVQHVWTVFKNYLKNNLKTVNGNSLLGTGDITCSGGSGLQNVVSYDGKWSDVGGNGTYNISCGAGVLIVHGLGVICIDPDGSGCFDYVNSIWYGKISCSGGVVTIQDLGDSISDTDTLRYTLFKN